MADGTYQVEGTKFGYREWSESYLSVHLSEMFQKIDYLGNWDLEMAFMNDRYEGFTVGYRVLIPSYLGIKLFFEITWTRSDKLVHLIAYHSANEVRQLVGVPEPSLRAMTSLRNVKTRRFL